MSVFDAAWQVVAPIVAFALPIAFAIDLAVWTVGGVALWRHRDRLTRRHAAVLAGTLMLLLAVRVGAAALL